MCFKHSKAHQQQQVPLNDMGVATSVGSGVPGAEVASAAMPCFQVMPGSRGVDPAAHVAVSVRPDITEILVCFFLTSPCLIWTRPVSVAVLST